ncbi:hypothetical protein FACS189487_11390 [Campylobacterota bacterium]|nr:hypothetical protein FACS189487_11390 [Campylobacterota bacterium]
MFNIPANTALILHGVTLQGRSGAVVSIDSGTFTMKTGSAIKDNIAAASSNGGGVRVYGTGTFNMEGGEISGNNSGANSGGGVYVAGTATFTMSGGTISGNSGSAGGGVYVTDSGTFTKTGGTIYGSNGGTDANTATSGDTYGHAVYINSSGKKRNTTAGGLVGLDSGTSINWE